jgi:uncharacterized membrane protein YedE/YeeE
MRAIVAFFVGALFSVGLVISGMTQPSKVVGFLDFFGDWDPSLAFVMGGAVLVNALLFRVAQRRARPWLDARFHLPTETRIEPRRVAGGVIFGIGWGIAGFCPGPAIGSLAAGSSSALVFVAAMLAGMHLYSLLERRGADSTP